MQHILERNTYELCIFIQEYDIIASSHRIFCEHTDYMSAMIHNYKQQEPQNNLWQIRHNKYQLVDPWFVVISIVARHPQNILWGIGC